MRSFWLRGLVLAASTGGLVAVSACSHLREAGPGRESSGEVACQPGEACADHTRVGRHPTVHALAHDLDRLEKHIECYGSVTAKVPDVWGQARLTQYREDFEREMAKDLPLFDVQLQGNSARSDQSYLAAALSLGLASQPSVPALSSVTAGDKSVVAADPKPILKTIETKTSFTDAAGKKTDTTKQSSLPDAAPPPSAPPPPPVAESPGEPAKLVTAADAAIKRDGVVTATKFEYADKGIGVEPAERLAQKKRYLDLLAQLRRENEGGDTADAPGYQLNLIRLPVSVLPGAHTDRAHGAEVTFTVDPVLGDDLLPTTFRRMVVNDIAQQLGLPITQALGDKEMRELLTGDVHTFVRVVTRLSDYTADPSGVDSLAYVKSLTDAEMASLKKIDSAGLFAELDALRHPTKAVPLVDAAGGPKPAKPQKGFRDYSKEMAAKAGPPAAGRPARSAGPVATFATPALSFANGLDNKLAFPTSQLFDVYGDHAIFEVAFGASEALADSTLRQGYAHLPDVQSYLKQELRAAYEFLVKNPQLFATHCDPGLVQDVRSLRVGSLIARRQRYRAEVAALTGSNPADANDFRSKPQQHLSKSAALAWMILVDSALLNDRLVRDVRESATAKGLPAPCPADGWPLYFLPDPPAEARQQFNAYVKMRWPVYVFALDPMTQEQNVADTLSTRRETQLALAVGFTNGAVSAKTFLNAARRLESEAETIALNRTQVGFAHGENTFGWRFYPRFQTMPTQTNFTVLFRDQLIGGPTTNATLRQRRLEPGPRECVALVVMPSFVPYVSVDSVSNWFRLADPKCKLLDHTASADLSRTVRSLERSEHTVTDAECYRGGELKRLQTRVQQLASRLPAQTLTVPVPVVNTLGGFEMFSNGTTDLAPELYGWYGAPGVSADRATTLFLVGDHFSPLQTRAIVGNSEVSKDRVALRMLSRQVMQVTVEAGALTAFTDPTDGVRKVQAHVATPYGVSRELLIPLVADKPAEKPAAPADGFSVSPDAVTVPYNLVPTDPADGTYRFASLADPDPSKLEVVWSDPTGSMPNAIEVNFVFVFAGKEVTVGSCPMTRVAGSADGRFVMSKDQLTQLAGSLIRAVGAGGLKPGANPLDAPFVTKRIEVTPVKDGTHAVQTKTTGNQLTLKFVGRYTDPAAKP